MAAIPEGFKGFIATATLTKFLFNLARRLVYPFAPEFARGLHTDLSAITSLIAINQATSLLGPAGAWFADRYGYKIIMLISICMLAAGSFAAGFIPLYSVLGAGLFIAGLAKSIFDPSLQAFISNMVPFGQRGKIIGITELAWAGCTIAGIPAAGLVIQRFSWQTPFIIIGVLSLASLGVIMIIMPDDRKIPAHVHHKGRQKEPGWETIVKNPRVVGMLSFCFCMSLANDNLFVIYGAWLEKSYNLSLAGIGFGTIFIGMAEISGETCTAFLSDRIGLKKSVLIGVSLCSMAYFILPVLDTGLYHVLAGLFIIFFTFEFTIVTSMSLSTELVPELRASTMAAFFATAGMGRVAGAFSGGMIWAGYGIHGICLVSGLFTLTGLACVIAGFRYKRTCSGSRN